MQIIIFFFVIFVHQYIRLKKKTTTNLKRLIQMLMELIFVVYQRLIYKDRNLGMGVGS